MARLLELNDARSRVRIAPELGGGVADMVARLPDGAETPVLRPWAGPETGLFGVGMNLLAPFSNRISGGGFAFGDAFHAIAPNLDGEPYPIHGDAFQKGWTVRSTERRAARLELNNGAIGPFRHRAEVDYRLENGTLTASLAITNTGPTLPFGGGFHPWFVRGPDTRLRFRAKGVWFEDRRHLPTDHHSLARRSDWSFCDLRPLPGNLINNAFTGWDGVARIVQPSLGIALDIVSPPSLTVAIVYSPGADADFFCFEPVSHAVDAVNQPGRPGLVTLAAGDTLTLEMSVGWSALGDAS